MAATSNNIDRLARELYEAVLAEYKANPGASFRDILNKHLSKFNKEVAALILDNIAGYVNEATKTTVSSGSSSSAVAELAGYTALKAPEISARLYTNAKQTALAAQRVIDEHLKTKGTINELRVKLYEGYGLRPVDEEILDINAKLPKYLKANLTEAQLAKLKTKELKAAYLAALDAKNDKQLAKALENALYEKSRYIAKRLAATEEHKAYTIAQAIKMKNDDVKYIKVSLSSAHKIFCICDSITGYNGTGYGAGVYKREDTPMPPFHPWCLCELSPFTPRRMWEPVTKTDYLDTFTKKEQDKLRTYDRSKWKIPTLGDLL